MGKHRATRSQQGTTEKRQLMFSTPKRTQDRAGARQGLVRQSGRSQMRLLLVDLAIWLISLNLVRAVRLQTTGEDLDGELLGQLLVFLCVAGTVAAVARWLGLYTPKSRVWPGSRTEDILIAAVNLAAMGVGTLVNATIMAETRTPLTVPVIAGMLATIASTLGRALWRWSAHRMSKAAGATRVVVFGTGRRAVSLISTIDQDTAAARLRYPAGVVAESEETDGKWVHGSRARYVRGAELSSFLIEKGAHNLIIATEEQLPGDQIMALREAAREAEAEPLVLPFISEANDGSTASTPAPLIDRVRAVEVSDLLGRDPVELDEAQIGANIRGKRVLITGAGGSIGSEICRQVHRFDPAEIIMLDRDEGGLHATELSMYGTALLDGKRTVLGDIRDAKSVHDLFMERRPDMVFHAAALKHMPLLETYPEEALKTNVLGTWNVLQACADAGVQTVVNISTDKAANPSTVLGESKRAAERLTAHMGETQPGTWVSVRFGNVFGSRGSVIETFSRQIEQGGPVTITAPGVNRYFMSIPEASQLVLQAAAIGRSGETMVLEMGKPVEILTVAQKIMDLSGHRVPVTYTGLRPGEKLAEELVDDRETPVVGDRHPMVTEVTVDADRIDPFVERTFGDETAVRSWLLDHGESTRGHEDIEGQTVDAPAEAEPLHSADERQRRTPVLVAASGRGAGK